MSATVTRDPFDIHPKISRAGLAGGLALVVAGVFAILGVPAPGWVAPVVSLAAAIIAGYLKAE